MGGVMALHLVYRFHKDVAAVFGLSTFLNDDSVVYKVCKLIRMFTSDTLRTITIEMELYHPVIKRII